MKHLVFTLLLSAYFSVNAQVIATVELEEPIKGMCGEIMYALYNGFGSQEAPKSDLKDEEYILLLNDNVKSLKDNLKFKTKTTLTIYINCEGKVIGCKTGIEKENQKLSDEITEVFLNYGNWLGGRLKDKEVDCSESIPVKIKGGKVFLNY